MPNREDYRRRYQATKMTVLDNQQSEVGSSSRLGLHKYEGKNNYFRFAPAQPGNLSYWYPFSRTYLELPVKNEDGTTEYKKRPVFNGRVHSEHKMDIIEEYITMVEKQGQELYGANSETYKSYIKHIHGYGSGANFVGGIRPSTVWMVYAWNLDAEGNFGALKRLEIKYTVAQDFKALASKEGGAGTEPFTDIDEGVPVNIIMDNSKKGREKWKGTFAILGDKNYPRPLPLANKQLEELDAAPSLEEIYVNSYKRRDFERALKGLRYFDRKHNYGVYDSAEFQDIVARLSDLYPPEEEGPEDNAQPARVSQPAPPPVPKATGFTATEDFDLDEEEEEEEEEVEKKDGDFLDKMDRTSLRVHIKENDLGIRVFKKMSDDDIRNAIREHVPAKGQEKPQQEDDFDDEPISADDFDFELGDE